MSSSRKPLRNAADQYLARCFADGTPPHVNEFAREHGLTPRSLGRYFLAEVGVHVSSYFKAARVERAQQLLGTTDLSLNAIAYAAGFGTRVTFFRAFKRATHLTPEEFRARNRDPRNLPKM
jgi:transcriptional regulator GlxA family with amidase domain